MAKLIKAYNDATPQSVAFNGTQGLNSLTDGEYTNESDAIDNSAGESHADFELNLGSAAFGTGEDNHLRMYILPTLDGTNYPTFTGGNAATPVAEIEQYSSGTFKLREDTGTVRVMLNNVPLPPTSFKIVMRSVQGAALSLAASGNTLEYRRWSYETA